MVKRTIPATRLLASIKLRIEPAAEGGYVGGGPWIECRVTGKTWKDVYDYAMRVWTERKFLQDRLERLPSSDPEHAALTEALESETMPSHALVVLAESIRHQERAA